VCDTYTDGVLAVLALVNECRWDPDARALRTDVKHEIGRRMATSTDNRVSPSKVVTPDCIVQFQESQGLIAEAKLGLPKNEEVWDEDIEQLAKYDDDLLGWWTCNEKISSHDLVALVPLARAVKFCDRLQRGVSDRKWVFQRNVAVVGFFKTSGVKDFLSLKKESGTLSLANLDQRLRESRLIEIALLITKYNDRKFVDHMPPTPYLLQIMWDHLFTRYAGDQSNGEVNSNPSLEVSVDQVTKDLQEYFGFKSNGPRSPEIPSSTWIRRALDTLVLGKLASKVKEGEYIIVFKRTRGDTLRKFGKLCFELDQRTKFVSTNQLSLLPNANER
jgi:hypothetical protein